MPTNIFKELDDLDTKAEPTFEESLDISEFTPDFSDSTEVDEEDNEDKGALEALFEDKEGISKNCTNPDTLFRSRLVELESKYNELEIKLEEVYLLITDLLSKEDKDQSLPLHRKERKQKKASAQDSKITRNINSKNPAKTAVKNTPSKSPKRKSSKAQGSPGRPHKQPPKVTAKKSSKAAKPSKKNNKRR